MLRIEARTLPNGWRLLVARSPVRLSDLEEIFLSGLVWTEIGIFGLGLGLGTLAGRRVLRGVALISEEVGRIGAGELDRRIPAIPGGGEIARIGQAVNLMLDRIGTLTDRLRQVTDDVAHDLRTPLGRLRQGLERSAMQAGDAAALRAGIEHALAETDAIIDTFNALLRIAQIEAQERRSGFVSVDPGALLLRLADAYGPSAEDSGHCADGGGIPRPAHRGRCRPARADDREPDRERAAPHAAGQPHPALGRAGREMGSC